MSKFLVKQAFAEAMDLHKNGRFEEAKEIYNKILKVDASEPNAHHLISLIFMAEGNLDDAKSHIELAIAKAPEQAMFHSNYGAILHSMGDLKGSVKELKKSLKIDKKLFQSMYSLGIVYTDMQQYEKAIENYLNALEINPSSAEAHNNIANLFSSLNNPEAEYHYKKTIELLPNEAYPLLNMANFLIKNGRFKDSIPLLKDLLDRGEESKEVYNSLGVAYKGIDDNENAKSMFNEALRVDPSFELAKKNMESLS